MRKRRCIVPADGFYEWAKRPDGKQPYYIHASDGSILAFAGLWERWTQPDDGEIIDSFTIITTAANDRMRELHDRMPVILAPDATARRLDPASKPDALSDLLGPCPDARLALHPVTRAVGNVRNEGAELIAAISGENTRTH